jgi:DNA invertase Pin-like site-specific DNA recombinase
LKVAIYARVSTEEQNAETQEILCREYCKHYNAEIYKVYTDSGISGTKTSRPAFDEMLKDMRLIKFNTIMVTKLDRIGRSLQHILSLFDEFNRKGVAFISVTQNIDTTTAAGKLQMQIIGAFAEFERNIISERTKEGMKGKINVGKRGVDKKPRLKRGGRRKPGIYNQKVPSLVGV